MASNFKISDLAGLGREPAASDVFIVNDASGVQQYTRSLTYADLLSGIAGGLTLQPIFFTFGVSYTGDPADFENVNSVDHLFDPKPLKAIQMPKGTDRAIVINSYGSSIKASPLVKDGNSTTCMAQFQYSVTLEGATWRLAPTANAVKMSLGSAFHMPGRYNYGVPDSYAQKSDSTRTNVINFADGAVVKFELDVSLRRGKKCIPGCGGGRMMLFPYSSTDEIAPLIDALTMVDATEGVHYGTADEDPDIFTPLTPVEVEQSTSQDIKNTIQFVIDRITQALEYDDDLTTDFPDSNYPNPLDGTTSNVTTLLTNLRKAAYDMKYDASTNVTDYNTKLDKIIFGDEGQSRPGLSNYIGYQFGFESNHSQKTM